MDEKQLLLLILVIVAIIVVFCLLFRSTESSPAEPDGCVDDADCSTGVCHEGTCVECVFDSDCCGTDVCDCNVCVPDDADPGPNPCAPAIFEPLTVDQVLDIDFSAGTGELGVSDPSLPGGARRFYTEVTFAAAGVLGSEMEVLSGPTDFTIENEVTVTSRNLIIYDGGTTGGETIAMGLGGLDLTCEGTAFELEVDFIDVNVDLDIFVYTTVGNYSTGSTTMTTTGTVSVPFASFVDTGAGADFTDVHAIVFQFEDASGGLDLLVTDIEIA